MTFQTAFPDYPAADMPTIPAGFEDTSWHNDICPSFTDAINGYRLFIDYADRAMREFDDATKRFTLYPLDEDGEQGEPLVETESWNEMLCEILDRID